LLRTQGILTSAAHDAHSVHVRIIIIFVRIIMIRRKEPDVAMSRNLPNPADEPTIDAKRAAAVLGVCVRTVYIAVERGEMPGIRVGKRVKIPTAKFLERYGLADREPCSPAA
jgi:excisionase family DNA binding protein